MNHSWRMIYWVCTAFIGIRTILVILTLPDTSWRRQVTVADADDIDEKTLDVQEEVVESAPLPLRKKFHWDL